VGTESIPETSEEFYTSTRLVAREDFIEYINNRNMRDVKVSQFFPFERKVNAECQFNKTKGHD
jgi:hypothetical protein